MGRIQIVTSRFYLLVKPIISVIFVSGAILLSTESVSTADEQSSWKAWERLSDEQAWALLPTLATGEKQPLPNWIKPVVLQMPRTAAAMLELDKAFRDGGPLEPALRAKLRWIIAHANGCGYGRELALADLRRVAGDKVKLSEFAGNPADWPASEADDFEFVRLLTVAGPTIPDELFERLRVKHGDRGVAAMVLLTAYGNFQDRLLLGLNVPIEKNGPYPPLNVKFAEGALQYTPLIPADNGVASYVVDGESVTPPDKAWTAITYDQLQQNLEKQRDRKPRLPVPTWDEVKGKLPEAMAVRPTSIRWSLVNYGYASELAIPWTLTTRTHWAELPSNRIFEESLFWVQTRAVGCNYCMGHCEMLLEVAGLDKEAVAERTRLLADTDWSSFPPAEQRAYAYAKKLSLTPKDLSSADYKTLEQDFDPKQAMSVFLWLCRGLYMTRISDGFQLPLERENVFGPSAPTEVPKDSHSEALATDELTQEAKEIVEELTKSLDKNSEALAMLNDIVKNGSNLGPDDGWFPLAKVENRFDWKYATKQYDTNNDFTITSDEFKGSEEDFSRIDRDHDGAITDLDFNWSEHSLTPSPGLMLFFMADRDANGKLTKEEFQGLFEQFSANSEFVSIDDLREGFSRIQTRIQTRIQARDPSDRTVLVQIRW